MTRLRTCAAARAISPWRAAKKYRKPPPWPDKTLALARFPDLEGHAILMQPGDGIFWNDPGYGHRVFWVTFSQGLTGNPQYWAVVDLSEEKVLKAGKEEAHR